MEAPQLYQAALYYVETLGFSVIPIVPGEKRPAIPWTEYQQRRPTRDELVEWFHEEDYQLGVVCGKVSGNLVVLDFETPTAYEEWASRHAELAGATRTVTTGKGVHVYFKLSEPAAGNTKLVAGLVETRGEGGMVLAPPSLHPSGRRYKLRGKVRDVVRVGWEDVSKGENWGAQPQAKKLDAKSAAQTIAFGRTAGERNDALFEAAVLLRDTNTPEAQAVAVLLKSNENNDPPLAADEIRRTVKSAYGKPPRNTTAEIETLAFKTIMDEIARLREEQATFWLKQATTPGLQAPNWAAKVRVLVSKAGSLNDVQIQEVIDEVSRHPPLVKRGKGVLMGIWRAANKRIRDALTGKATDDDIANAYKAEHEMKRMYTRQRWYGWNGNGVWSETDCDVSDEIWHMMIEFKQVDVRPSSHKRRSIEECLQGLSWMGVPEMLVDANPEWINLLNGIYDISTGELLPHEPAQYITTQLPFKYAPDATCPLWDKFLSEVLVDREGASDEDMITFIQQAFGYSLTAWTKYEMSFWLQGRGANGKSTMIHILTALSGNAARAFNLGMLEKDLYQLAQLAGIRVVTCTESPVGLKVADSIVKSLVSGDKMSVRAPYGHSFELLPVCKIWWAMNNFPRVADTSEGFWRKVRVIPFYARFEGEARDEDLRSKLLEELPGIFNWALEGLASLMRDGWIECAAVEEATGAYRQSNDVELAFVEDQCTLGASYRVKGKMLYTAYKGWCEETGHRPKTMTRVAQDWMRLGFSKRRLGDGIHYFGLRLVER